MRQWRGQLVLHARSGNQAASNEGHRQGLLRMKEDNMSQTRSHYPGHLPLAPGRAVALEPRTCGTMQVGAGALVVGDKLLGPGDKLRLWRGDSVQVVNIAHRTTAFFAWDACAEQPGAMERFRRAFGRVRSLLNRRTHAGLEACGGAGWCVRA